MVSAFPEEICPIPRKWAEKAYPKLVYYKRHPKGAHFAAWEQPQALVEDASRRVQVAAVVPSQVPAASVLAPSGHSTHPIA